MAFCFPYVLYNVDSLLFGTYLGRFIRGLFFEDSGPIWERLGMSSLLLVAFGRDSRNFFVRFLGCLDFFFDLFGYVF